MRHKNDNFNLKINNLNLPKSECTKYLGVHMDNKLSWKDHEINVANKVNQKLRLIKRLAGATWGCTQDTLNTTYKTYIKPVMTYGSEILVTASNSNLKTLETTQNNALRLISGGVKTTPALSLQLYTGHLPITSEINQQAAISLAKIKALPQAKWAKNSQDGTHLKTQTLPVNTANKYLTLLGITTEIEPFCPKIKPTEYQTINTNLSLLSDMKKQDAPPTILHQMALATINERYPQDEYLRIYTDGSLIGKHGKAGAGVHCELFSHYISVGENKTSFDGEIKAIHMALQQLLLRPLAFKKAVFLVDSKSAIQSIASNRQPIDSTVKETKDAINLLSKQGKTIILQWIPSHVGISGNETADLLAKKGTTLQGRKTLHSTRTIKRLVKNKTQEMFTNEASLASSGKRWKNIGNTWDKNKNIPRNQAVANFRLNTGHDCLAEHLHRIKIYKSHHCTICKQLNTVMNRDHLLVCSGLDHSYQETGNLPRLYWDARRQME